MGKRRRRSSKGMRKSLGLKTYGHGGANWGAMKEFYDFGKADYHPLLNPSASINVSLEKQKVNDQIKVLQQSDFRQFLETFNRILVKQGREKIYLYFSGQRWFFYKEDTICETKERSLIYQSKEQAMLYMRLKRITWVSIKE